MPSTPKSKEDINRVHKKTLILRLLFNVSATTKKNAIFCIVLPKKVRALILKLLLKKTEIKQIMKKTKIA